MSALSAVPSTCVRRCTNLGVGSCTECIGQRNDFELIPMVKIETGHSVEGSFGNEFRSIYNHCEVMAAWSRTTLKKIVFFAFFWKKRPLTGTFQTSVLKGFIATSIAVLFKFREIWPTGNRWNRTLLTWQKNSPGSPALATARIAPKIYQGQPENVLRVLQISSKSVHFRQSYSRTRKHRQNGP